MKFSVITICYNAEKVIEKTMRSVLLQTFSDFEYILVDGASGDATNDIIRACLPAFEQQGIPVRYISEPDRGISDAFNKGICLAAGEIVSLINAGDTLMPDALERVANLMDDGVDVLYGNVLWENESAGVRYVRRSKADLSRLMYNMDMMHPATFVKRAVYEKAGVFDTRYRYCMDQELLVRVQKCGCNFRYADEVFARMEAGGVSDTDVWKVLCEAALIPQKYGEPLWKVNVSKWYKFLRNRLSRVYRWFVKN